MKMNEKEVWKMVETLQISMFFLILFLSFAVFAVVLRAEAIRSGHLREKSEHSFKQASSLLYKKTY